MPKKSKIQNFQKSISSIKKILYLHDFEGWAIHNVGKLWLNKLPHIETTFKDIKKVNKKDFLKYDLIWFGYLDLYLYFYLHNFFNHNLKKYVLAIHDPSNLFPAIKNWKLEKINLKRWWSYSCWLKWMKLRLLKKASYVVTISKEMKCVLQKYGIDSYLIPTTSSLPIIKEKKIITKKCNLHSVFNTHYRKNMKLMKFLQNYCINKLKIKFDLKLGNKILSTKNYIKLLDNHEIYVCTSFQEGGPLPAMDAMHRGSVVITTPIGQIQDIIENGKNGFVCKTRKEFLEKITLLSKDLNLLHKMRITSRNFIRRKRKEKIIKQKVLKFLGNCFKNSQKTQKGVIF